MSKDQHPATATAQWQCGSCSYIYDEAEGWPVEGIAPGTRWADVPHDWRCPDCSSSKDDFQAITA
jgi:rubredoxin-NAD+ reductase